MLIHHPNVSLQSSQTLYCDIANPKSYSGAGSSIIDLTRNKYNMTISGTITYSSSFGGILSFTGLSTQFIAFNTASAPQSAGASFTFSMEVWTRISSLSAVNGLFNEAAGLIVNIDTTGAIQLKFRTATTIATSASSLINTGIWYHIVITRTAANLYTAYINGVSVASGTNASNLNTASARIGYGGGTTASFNGDIAIVKTYKGTVLTQSQIIQNYTAIKGRFGL